MSAGLVNDALIVTEEIVLIEIKTTEQYFSDIFFKLTDFGPRYQSLVEKISKPNIKSRTVSHAF
jgi:hypothetical protein